MAVLTKRSRGYICGLVLFVIGTVVFATGFATSRWSIYAIHASSNGRVDKVYFGLWTVCVEHPSGNVRCMDLSSSPFMVIKGAWLRSVRALQCLALLIIYPSLCYAVVVNCLLDNAKFLRVLEVGTGISGGLGLVGAITFAAEYGNYFNNLGLFVPHVDSTVGWSFGVNVGGAVVILLSSALIACFNKPLDPLAAANSPGMVFSTINGGEPVVTVGGGVGATAPVPMGNNPYVTPAYSYPPPALQGQDQGLVQPAVMTMPNSQTKY